MDSQNSFKIKEGVWVGSWGGCQKQSIHTIDCQRSAIDHYDNYSQYNSTVLLSVFKYRHSDHPAIRFVITCITLDINTLWSACLT